MSRRGRERRPVRTRRSARPSSAFGTFSPHAGRRKSQLAPHRVGTGRPTAAATPRSDPAAKPCAPGNSRRTGRSRPKTPPPAPITCPFSATGSAPNLPTSSAPTMPIAMPIDAADQRDQHRLGQELLLHVRRPGADRHAQADLADALGHRDQHDVHDADAADDQRDRRHRAEQQRHQPRGRGARGDDLGNVAHVEIVLVAGLRSCGAGAAAPRLRSCA